MLAKKIEFRLNLRELVDISVQITIRFHNRNTITRSRKLHQYIYKKEDIYRFALNLFQENWNGTPVRLLGIAVQDIEERSHIAEQLNLFTYQEKINEAKLAEAKRRITSKFGED